MPGVHRLRTVKVVGSRDGRLCFWHMSERRAPHPRTPIVVLFDVDNTLLDNDRVERDLRRFLEDRFGADCRDRYFAIFERLRAELGYADYLGALQRFRVEHRREPDVLALTYFLIEYPFADLLYPRALEVVRHAQGFGLPVVLSDGDVVFQPWKVKRSGLLDAFAGRALIYIHKETMLDEVERQYPADHYVLIDDKVRILSAIKGVWGPRVTTVFPRQGHYAADRDSVKRYPAADVTVDAIADLLAHAGPELIAAASSGPTTFEVAS
jgi:FMN phosphatase YigB (HAD superfamily)